MNRDEIVLLSDILKSIENIEKYTKDVSEEKFFKDEKTQDAVIRRLEIIGEATKNLPEHFKKQQPHIEWKKIAGMRDVLIHGYFGVNMERVWLVMRKELLQLKENIISILNEKKK